MKEKDVYKTLIKQHIIQEIKLFQCGFNVNICT